MAQETSTPIDEDILSYLEAQENKSLLRAITCGSVDDGKSTLLGRLLYDSKLLYDDHLAALDADSKKQGTTGDGNMDFALLLDGLEAEREQGITIDVAYRFFSTETRKFIIADTPGHEQYTRNMATGASTADAAIILVDARNGILTQTCRHSYIVHLLGLRQIVLAVNKMDLMAYEESIFNEIYADYQKLLAGFGSEATVHAVPLSALHGDNVVTTSAKMSWYEGPALLDILEGLEASDTGNMDAALRMSVQWVNRPNHEFRGFTGTIAQGRVSPGTPITALPSGRKSTVERIVSRGAEGGDEDLDEAIVGEAVTLVLGDEIDISRGDMISAVDDLPIVSDQFTAHLIWMTEDNMLPGRQYILKCSHQTVNATITELKHKINVNTLEHQAAKVLELNDIALCNISTDQAIVFEAYKDNRRLGGFILIDKLNNQTVGAGMIDFSLRRATNIAWQELEVNKQARARIKEQKPCIVWFTGLSGSGKSTIANLVEKRLIAENKHSYILDGDNVRHGLNRDLGFTDADRVENIRRIGEVARLYVDAGIITLVSFISPFANERRMVRELVEADEFIEIYVSTPLEVCEARDPKGLYEKVRAGKIKNFTGIDADYEAPENPELVLDTTDQSAEQCAGRVILYLRDKGLLQGFDYSI